MPPGIHFLAPIVLGFVYIFFVSQDAFKKLPFRQSEESIAPLVDNRYFIIFSFGSQQSSCIYFYACPSMAIKLHLRYDILFYHKPGVVFKSRIFCTATISIPEFLKEKAGQKNKTVHLAKRKGTGVKGAF